MTTGQTEKKSLKGRFAMDTALFVVSAALTVYWNQRRGSSSTPLIHKRSKTDVVTLGLLCLDIHACHVDSLPPGGGVQFIDTIHLSCAGTSGGTVVTLAKLGMTTAILGCIGSSDEKGRYLIDKLRSLGVCTRGLQYSSTKATSATVINVRSNGDRPCLHQRGASDDLDLSTSSVLDQVLESSPRVIHIGGLGLFPGCAQEKTLPGFLLILNKSQSISHRPIIVMDLIAPHSGTLACLLPILPYVDYFMPSLEEAELISGATGVLACALFFLNHGVRKACVLKDGARGSFLVQTRSSDSTGTERHNNTVTHRKLTQTDVVVTHQPAFKIDQVVDTTGCGDNYCAGFECGLLKGWNLVDCCRLGAATSALCATGVGSELSNFLIAQFLSKEIDAAEIIYTRFNNLISCEPSIRTLLPLSTSGIESEEDEVFKITTKDGKMIMQKQDAAADSVVPDYIFEDEPADILNTMLTLYFSATMMRCMQESVASELASRMTAMQSASNNAKKITNVLSQVYNRARQATVTQEILEIVAGANALAE